VSLDSKTATVLKAGTLVGIAIMAAGILLSSFDISEDIMYAGVVILVCTPMAGVFVSTACLYKEGDKKWTGVAIVLIAVILLGLLITSL